VSLWQTPSPAQDLINLTPPIIPITDALDMGAVVLQTDAQPTVISLSWSNVVVVTNEYTVVSVSEDLVTWYQPFELQTTPAAVVYLASTNSQLFFRLKNQLGQ
jgi:hypothetical protein